MKKEVKQAIDSTYASIQRIAAGLHQFKLAHSFNDEKTKKEVIEQLRTCSNEIASNIAIMEGAAE